MNARQRAILVGVLLDRDAILRRGERSGMERYEWQDAKQGVVRMNAGDWIGRRTSSDSTLNGRAIRALEAKGLVERCAMGCGGTVTTHLKLLPAGEIAAARLLSAQADAGGETATDA